MALHGAKVTVAIRHNSDFPLIRLYGIFFSFKGSIMIDHCIPRLRKVYASVTSFRSQTVKRVARGVTLLQKVRGSNFGG